MEIRSFLQPNIVSNHHKGTKSCTPPLSPPHSLQIAPAATLAVSFGLLKWFHKERQEALRLMRIFFYYDRDYIDLAPESPQLHLLEQPRWYCTVQKLHLP